MVPLISRAARRCSSSCRRRCVRRASRSESAEWRTIAADRAADDLGGIAHRGDARGRPRRRRDCAPSCSPPRCSPNAIEQRPAAGRGTRSRDDLRLLEAPDPHLNDQAWAAAFLLIVFVLRPASARASCCTRRGSSAGGLASAEGPRSQAFHQSFTRFQPTIGRGGVRHWPRPPRTSEGEREIHEDAGSRCRRARPVAARCGDVVAGKTAARPTSSPAPAATFPSPLISQWQAEYGAKTGVQIDYSPIGSGGGIAAITDRTVDFGASDAPLTRISSPRARAASRSRGRCRRTRSLYNLRGVPNNLKLTGDGASRTSTSATSRSGTTRRSRSSIRASACPTRTSRPSTALTAPGRPTTSWTTSLLSARLQDRRSASRPRSTSRSASAAAAARALPASSAEHRARSAYADIAYALANKIKFTSIKNRPASSLTPGLRGDRGRGRRSIKKVPAGNEMHIVNPPKGEPLAYPICTFSYVLLPHEDRKGADAAQVRLLGVLTQGQKFGAEAPLRPIPNVVLFAAERTLKQVQTLAPPSAPVLRVAGALRGARAVLGGTGTRRAGAFPPPKGHRPASRTFQAAGTSAALDGSSRSEQVTLGARRATSCPRTRPGGCAPGRPVLLLSGGVRGHPRCTGTPRSQHDPRVPDVGAGPVNALEPFG